ncbi:MAG: hypothetical protein AB7G54_05070 [Methyloceanibacter sp.]
MMRALILLSLAGVTAYMLLPANVEREGNAVEKVSTARLEPLPDGERKLRSWGSTLQSLDGDSEGAQPVGTSDVLKQEALYQPYDAAEIEASPPIADTGARRAAETAMPAAAIPDPAHAAWAKVIHGARAHSAASISSPVTKFYPQGKELQIVGRESGWIELLDPATQERGFVFEKYLVAIDAPGQGQPVTQASAEPLPAPATPLAAPKAQTPRFAAKPMQATNEVGTMRPDELAPEGKRDRAAKKEERRQRKLFRLFGRNAAPEAWTVGAPR